MTVGKCVAVVRCECENKRIIGSKKHFCVNLINV